MTYAYEQSQGHVIRFHWDDGTKKLTADGAPASEVSALVEVVGR